MQDSRLKMPPADLSQTNLTGFLILFSETLVLTLKLFCVQYGKANTIFQAFFYFLLQTAVQHERKNKCTDRNQKGCVF